jgi:hypothetical protein
VTRPSDDLAERAKALCDEEKLAYFRALAKDRFTPMPEALWKDIPPETIEKGLDRIRFWRRARIVVWVTLALAGVLLDQLGVVVPSNVGGIVVVGVLMSVEARLLWMRCPRCGHDFVSRALAAAT